MPLHTFQQLEDFILKNKNPDVLDIMDITARKGVGKVITAKNYVGIITFKDGTTIEILPKICSAISGNSNAKARKLVIEMLKTLRNSPYKNLQTANVSTAKMNIFEVFVRMFLDELFFIVKRGLKCSYESLEENLPYYKGKIQFSQQIRFNQVHKERSYVVYDAFTVNRPENRLLKATLLYLYKHSTSPQNRNDIKILLGSFAEVPPSTNYQSDFQKYVPDRNMKDYTTALMWSRVFLMGKSFTSFSGSEVAFALLFPMETLYESYVATKLKRFLFGQGYTVAIQDSAYYLFEEPAKRFALRPDIIVTRQSDKTVFILDTKWKLLDSQKPNYGLSQADMYQMAIYQQKYHAENVILLYPRTDWIKENTICFSGRIGQEEHLQVQVQFLDMFDVGTSIQKLEGFLSLRKCNT